MTFPLLPKSIRTHLQRRNLVTGILCAILTSIITTIVLGNAHRNTANRTTSDAPFSIQQSTDETSEIQSLLIEVRPYGFISSDLTVPAGKYLISLNNRTGRTDLTFRIDRESDGRISQSKSNIRDWREQIVLRAGTYNLSEANNPSWHCAIHVTSR
jgi:hypothetical protein